MERLWRACAASGDLYRRHYEGLYCVGCEQFYPTAELAAGRCPDHGTVPDLVAEENWFFRLSRYAAPLRDLIADGTIRVEPATRRNEALALIDGGATVDPYDLAAAYGTDAVRWWLLREVPRVGDADFTVERLVGRANDELANGFGNLVNRVVALIHRYRGGHGPAVTASTPDAAALDGAVSNAPGLIAGALDDFDFRRATDAVWRIADEANRYVNHARPWELAKAGRTAELAVVLSSLLRACQAIGTHLAPFLPDAAARITGQCTPDAAGVLPRPAPLLPRITEAQSGHRA